MHPLVTAHLNDCQHRFAKAAKPKALPHEGASALVMLLYTSNLHGNNPAHSLAKHDGPACVLHLHLPSHLVCKDATSSLQEHGSRLDDIYSACVSITLVDVLYVTPCAYNIAVSIILVV